MNLKEEIAGRENFIQKMYKNNENNSIFLIIN